jgi:hypothetical protein
VLEKKLIEIKVLVTMQYTAKILRGEKGTIYYQTLLKNVVVDGKAVNTVLFFFDGQFS